MKIIAIGDVHGRSFWKLIANTETFDRLVLIGDYFDSFDIDAQEQIKNFRELIAFKEANPERVILLVGNHDFHYLPAARAIQETYSGFQEKYHFQISFLLQEHTHLLQMSFLWKDYLFTHAGVTQTWITNAGYQTGEIDVFLNDLFRYKPGNFFFNGRDAYGDNVTQSPVWVRPYSLKKDAFKYEMYI